MKPETRNQKPYSNPKLETRSFSNFEFLVSGLDKVSSFKFRILRPGFTLLELTVAVGLFASIMIILAGIFLSTSRQSERARQNEIQARDARSIIEFITREIRTATIDYTGYGDPFPTMPVLGLRLRRPDGQLINIAHSSVVSDTFCTSTAARPCLLLGVDLDRNNLIEGSIGEVTALSGNEFKVPRFNIYLTPTSDPFRIDRTTGAIGPNTQPRTTIVLVTEGIAGHATEKPREVWQTTVSSRLYRR